MDDLAGKISELLGNPEIMNTIKGLSGLKNSSESLDSEENSHSNADVNSEENFEFPAEMMQTVLKLAPLFSSMKKEDKYTNFLKALKPMLSESRQNKLDSSSQILQIIKILPLLKNQGLF